MSALSSTATIRAALLSPIMLSAACAGSDSGPSAPYLGTLDPIIYVGQLTPPSKLVATLDGAPLPATITLRIDSGDASAFTITGSSLTATEPGDIYMTVSDGPSRGATTVHVGAIYDTRGKWLFRKECPWVGDSTHATWESITVRSDFTDYQPATQPAWLVFTAVAETKALATTFDTTITVVYQGGTIVQVDTNAQTTSSAIAVSSKSAPLRIDIPRAPYPFLEVGFPTASGDGGLGPLPVTSVSPLVAGDSGQTFCGGVFSSDPTLHRSSITELRAMP